LQQPENAAYSMLVTLSGIVRSVNPRQRANAEYPIHVTVLQIVTLVRLLQSKNAPGLMLVTGQPPKEAGIVIAPDVEAGTAVNG
jgi:hypothetical protein